MPFTTVTALTHAYNNEYGSKCKGLRGCGSAEPTILRDNGHLSFDLISSGFCGPWRRAAQASIAGPVS